VQVHGIHDLMFEGTPEIGAAWLRQQPLDATWQRLVLVPVGGGVLVGGLNYAREFLSESGATAGASEAWQRLTGATKPVLKAVAAAVTLGTGNSLGPEGPSVEIGASVAGGLGTLLKNSRERTLALVAAGSAAGISSGEPGLSLVIVYALSAPYRPLSPTSLSHYCLSYFTVSHYSLT
jgi:H+/Cl- antiporter ClcA